LTAPASRSVAGERQRIAGARKPSTRWRTSTWRTRAIASTAALWRGLAEELAQWIYRRLSGENVRLRLEGAPSIEIEARRRAQRWRLGNRLQRPFPATCAECGKALPKGRRRFCSEACKRAWYGIEDLTSAGMAAIASLTPEQLSARSRRSAASRTPAARSEAARTAARARWARRKPEGG
jgi:hypothetical protein